MSSVAWLALAACCGLMNIGSELLQRRTLKYATKPATLLLIMLAVGLGDTPSASVRNIFLLAFGLSMLGDIALMLERDLFLYGLLAFLAAHLAFIAGFSYELAASPPLLAMLPFLAHAALMLRWLWPEVPSKLRAPVVVYVAALVAMGITALGFFLEAPYGRSSGALLLAGALSFLVSDSVLAVRRFRGDFKGAQTAILLSYFAAQLAFAGSVLGA